MPDLTTAANNSAGWLVAFGRCILAAQNAAISFWSVWTFWR